MNKTSLIYKGVVDVRLIIGDKVIDISNHNQGTPNLMKILAMFLSGNGNNSLTPQYLDVRRKNTTDADVPENWETCCFHEISASSRIYEYVDSNWQSVFTFSLSSSNLTDYVDASDTSHNYRFYLCSKEDVNLVELAYLDATVDELSKITPGIQATIEWRMQISNPTKTSNPVTE